MAKQNKARTADLEETIAGHLPKRAACSRHAEPTDRSVAANVYKPACETKQLSVTHRISFESRNTTTTETPRLKVSLCTTFWVNRDHQGLYVQFAVNEISTVTSQKRFFSAPFSRTIDMNASCKGLTHSHKAWAAEVQSCVLLSVVEIPKIFGNPFSISPPTT